jgi:hypothetical protein
MEQETSKKAEIKALSIANVISSALPCPFCGEKPNVDKNYVPSTVEITCNNNDCHTRPSVYESVECVENKGDTITYSPMFEWHWQSILDKWNTRYCL